MENQDAPGKTVETTAKAYSFLRRIQRPVHCLDFAFEWKKGKIDYI